MARKLALQPAQPRTSCCSQQDAWYTLVGGQGSSKVHVLSTLLAATAESPLVVDTAKKLCAGDIHTVSVPALRVEVSLWFWFW